MPARPTARLADQEGADHADTRQDDAQPLTQRQSLARYQPVQAAGGEQRRRVDEHHHVRGAGVVQAHRHAQELHGEQRTGEQAGNQGLVPAQTADAAPACQAIEQPGRQQRAPADLQQRVDLFGDGLDRRLLQAPDQAKHQHHQHGGEIELLAHERRSTNK